MLSMKIINFINFSYPVLKINNTYRHLYILFDWENKPISYFEKHPPYFHPISKPNIPFKSERTVISNIKASYQNIKIN